MSAHLFDRNDRFLWGGYVGFSNFSAGPGAAEDWSVGLEGQLYLDRVTLTGAAGYMNISVSGGSGFDVWTADAEARYFITDNLSVHGNVGYADPESAVIIGEGWVGGLGGEYQFAGMPISIYGGWQHSDFEGVPEEVDTIGLGVRYSWNATLYERNRSGPSLHRPQGIVERLSGAFAPR